MKRLTVALKKLRVCLKENDPMEYSGCAYLEQLTTARNLLWAFLADLCSSAMVGFVVAII